MKAGLKAKWIKALRSGEFKQTRGVLRRSSAGSRGYCCLGVLKTLDPKIRKARNGDEILSPATCGLSKEVQNILARKNDKGSGFKAIADYIEKHV